MKQNTYNASEIKKIIADYINRNEIAEDITEKKIIDLMTEPELLSIDSEQLELGGNKFFAVIEVAEGDSDKGVELFAAETEKARKIIEEKTKYSQFELVFIVKSISAKIAIEEKIDSRFKQKIRRKGMRVADIEIKLAFIQEWTEFTKEIGISSGIRCLNYTLGEKENKSKNEKEKTPEIACIYTACLFDLVELYDKTGDKLYEDNVRFQIADKLDVDKKINNTLKTEPDKFWLFNNGVTLLIDRECVNNKKTHRLGINAKNNNRISIINGAQTISAAAHFFYSSHSAEQEIVNAKESAQVVLRVIFYDTKENNEQLYNEISLSLNRQKAINEANMRYTDQLVEDINELYESNGGTPYFHIVKEGEQKTEDSVSVTEFAKIAAIYLLQQPGLARSSKTKLIKADDYWNRLRVDAYEDKTMDAVFKEKYLPFLNVKKLFYTLSDLMNASKNSVEEKYRGWYSYGTEFLTAYIMWVLNDKDCTNFSLFQCEMKGESLLKPIIDEFAHCACKKYEESKETVLVTNVTKLDSWYKELREYFDNNCSELNRLITELEKSTIQGYT